MGDSAARVCAVRKNGKSQGTKYPRNSLPLCTLYLLSDRDVKATQAVAVDLLVAYQTPALSQRP